MYVYLSLLSRACVCGCSQTQLDAEMQAMIAVESAVIAVAGALTPRTTRRAQAAARVAEEAHKAALRMAQDEAAAEERRRRTGQFTPVQPGMVSNAIKSAAQEAEVGARLRLTSRVLPPITPLS